MPVKNKKNLKKQEVDPESSKDIEAEYSYAEVAENEEEPEYNKDLEKEEPVLSEVLPEVAGSFPSLDPLKKYMEDISKYALLTPEEEMRLALKLKETGDLNAARRLILANLRLVVKIAMEYRSAYMSVMDLIQEGNVGLMKAVSKFDPTKGAKLSYYASWWIRSYILKHVIDNFRLVKIGTTQAQKKLFYQLMREKQRLEAQGLEGGPKLLAERLNVKEKEVVEMSQRLGSSGTELSLQAPLDDGGENRVSHQDMLRDQHEMPDEELARNELVGNLKSSIPEFEMGLKDREIIIFRERMVAEDPKTLQEIADKFGMTRERARQIEARVIEKLRDFFRSKFGV